MEHELLLRAEARVGTVLRSKYRLERVLGVGGMAVVYAGSHRNGNPVAVKVLHRELSIDLDVRGRFLREGYIANKVEHPGVVRVLDDDTSEDGAVFLVMDLLQGETVDARLNRAGGRLPVAEVCAIAHQLLDVLGAAHAKGIVHRDIKPENLFLTTDAVVKVLDFGIARLREPGSGTSTRTGMSMGTPAFMPPEQARGRNNEIDGQTDLWAVGATMFTLLAGEHVHEGAATTEEIVIATATRPARSLRQFADIPEPIADVVDRALAFAKEDRWPSASAMQQALERAYFATCEQPLGALRLLPLAPSLEPKDPVSSGRARASIPEPRSSTAIGLSRDGAVEQGAVRRRLAPTALVAVLSLLVASGVAAGIASYAAHGSRTKSTLASALPPALVASTSSPTPRETTRTDPRLSTSAAPTLETPILETIEVGSLPLASSSRSVRSPTRPPAGATSPRAATSASRPFDCHLESYVEIIKGEPVTRYRQICP